MDDDDPPTSTTDYRLTRVEREMSDMRSKIEAGQGAMLQAVSSVQTQLAQFQISLSTDLANRFLTRPDADELRHEVRERAAANAFRIEKLEKARVDALEKARMLAEQKQSDDAKRTLQINLAFGASAVSLVAGIALHFAPHV